MRISILMPSTIFLLLSSLPSTPSLIHLPTQVIKDEPISESPYFTASPSLSQDRSVTQTEALGLQNIAISVASQNGANNSGKGEKNKTTGTVNSTRGPSEKALASLPKTVKIFQTIVNVEHSLGEFRKLFLPSFVKVLDDTEIVLETRRITLCYLMHLANDTELHQFVPRIIQPLLRLLSCKKESPIQAAAITAFSCLVCRLGANYAPYVIPVRRRMKAMAQREGSFWYHQIDEYETLVARLLRQRSLPSEPASAPDIAIRYDIIPYHIVSYLVASYHFITYRNRLDIFPRVHSLSSFLLSLDSLIHILLDLTIA